MNNILVVVDMQNDFIDGALGTKEAEAIVDKVVNRIRTFDGEIFATQDTHFGDYLDTQEGKKLPVKHCIAGTNGWNIEKTVNEFLKKKNASYIGKTTFAAQYLMEALKQKCPDSITFVGLCTGICVLSNAIMAKSMLPETRIIVDSSCCACVTPESHKTALEAMKLCQIDVI